MKLFGRHRKQLLLDFSQTFFILSDRLLGFCCLLSLCLSQCPSPSFSLSLSLSVSISLSITLSIFLFDCLFSFCCRLSLSLFVSHSICVPHPLSILSLPLYLSSLLIFVIFIHYVVAQLFTLCFFPFFFFYVLIFCLCSFCPLSLFLPPSRSIIIFLLILFVMILLFC